MGQSEEGCSGVSPFDGHGMTESRKSAVASLLKLLITIINQSINQSINRSINQSLYCG